MLHRIMARGYAKSRQITVLITDNFNASHRALECSAVAIARILSNVNAPLFIGQTIVEDHAQRHDDKHG